MSSTPVDRVRGTERGSMSLELAILMPVVLLLLFGIVQAGLYVHAREVALHAASAGSAAASAENASDATGHDVAAGFVAQVGSLEDVQVVVDRDAQQVTVTVSGQSPSLVPGWSPPRIVQSATSPIEGWIP